jgi:flavodoxin
MESVQAIYASTSGNVEMTVETVARAWQEQGYEVELHRSEVVSPQIISDNHFFVFAVSTWDHGIFNPYFTPIFEEILKTDCAGKAAFFIGCGDFRYEPVNFNMGIQKIHDAWRDQGGTIMLHPLKINGDPELSVHNVINPWIEKSIPQLATLFERNNA